jgi:HD-GYP domain-containing protein (c-di-GMP phosphodiesterase class II)/DNA-binding CsgD family transcriptional regulator
MSSRAQDHRGVGALMDERGTIQVRLAELLGALSLVVDLGLGQPMEHVIRQTLIAARLGESLDLSETERAAVYYTALLAWVGCGSDSHELAAWFGDDIAFRAGTYDVDMAGIQLLAFLARRLGGGSPPLRRGWVAASFAAGGMNRVADSVNAHCRVTRTFAERIGLGDDVRQPLLQLFERWDGKGAPERLSGDQIMLAARIVQLADIAAAFHRAGGVDAATGVVRQRRGTQFDPALVDRFCAEAEGILSVLVEMTEWDALLAAEPEPQVLLTEGELDRALEAIADFTDIKSPYTVGHARAVSELAGEGARRVGLAEEEVALIRRAALVQDAGRMGVPNSIWDKPTALAPTEAERVRLHAYFIERMLAKPPALTRIGALAAQHHERLDGSGYPRGLTGRSLPLAARILAAADVYQAMVEARPYRPAREARQAAGELQAEVKGGRLDGEAVNAVLAVAGHRVHRIRVWPAGLTRREVEVLALIARGSTNRDVARRLQIAHKTVGNHVEHIYVKLGSSTRAEASLFAMQHGLLGLAGLPER